MRTWKYVLPVVVLVLWALLSYADEETKPAFPIKVQGTEFPVDYEKYGEFYGTGTNDYKYKITDRNGLRSAIGGGLSPSNHQAMLKDPDFYKWNKTRPKDINPWDYVSTGDPQTDYYAWLAGNGVAPGTRLFFIGQALTDGGHFALAVKAYYAILIHYPKEPCWGADHSYVWYPAEEALSRIESITKHHPELGYRLRGAKFEVKNGDDTDLKNDEFIIHPGHWEKWEAGEAVDLSQLEVIQRRGKGKVHLVQYKNKHWQLLVDGNPMMVRGITYNPTPIGQDIANEAGYEWMHRDEDDSGTVDAPYESWVDANKNGTQDPNEPQVGDFELLQQMGVNAIRLFRFSTELEYNPEEFNKELLRDMHRRYGISAIMADFLGAYTVGSGASWEEGTDYTDKEQLKSMERLVRDYVLDHRDEPYVLMWLLGNENLMPSDFSGVNATRTQASEQVKAYLKFVNRIAKMIHKLDPNHPVAVGNWELVELEAHGKYAPAVDIYGSNSYRGAMGFGDLWRKVQEAVDRPVLITEYGCDAYNSTADEEDPAQQARCHEGAWKDIVLHTAGGSEEGNAIGGMIFEYLDEWWKSQKGSWSTHQASKDASMAFPDGWSSEEYLGIVSQGDGTHSPFLRQPRETYYLYRDKLWKD